MKTSPQFSQQPGNDPHNLPASTLDAATNEPLKALVGRENIDLPREAVMTVASPFCTGAVKPQKIPALGRKKVTQPSYKF